MNTLTTGLCMHEIQDFMTSDITDMFQEDSESINFIFFSSNTANI